jgi:hypothetical protein
MLLSYATCYFILKKFFTHTHSGIRRDNEIMQASM